MHIKTPGQSEEFEDWESIKDSRWSARPNPQEPEIEKVQNFVMPLSEIKFHMKDDPFGNGELNHLNSMYTVLLGLSETYYL